MEASPFHFSRQDPRGQCLTCKGSGGVLALKEELVIGDRRVAPEEESFLQPAAAVVMKGVRRAEMLPFFRRMSEEGLWKQGTPYRQLDETARNLLLYGCWTRPGHGTFLKNVKADASEVNAWLRWDGLYNHLVHQSVRSADAKWKQALEGTRSTRPCPTCEGTGLSAAARLLLLDGRSLQDWVREASVRELSRAMEELRTSTPRQERTKRRVLKCMAPLVSMEREWTLLALADAETAWAVGQQVVSAFTDMHAIQP